MSSKLTPAQEDRREREVAEGELDSEGRQWVESAYRGRGRARAS